MDAERCVRIVHHPLQSPRSDAVIISDILIAHFTYLTYLLILLTFLQRLKRQV